MKTFKDLKVGDVVYIISNCDSVTIQSICDIIKFSYRNEFILKPDPIEGFLLKASFDVFSSDEDKESLLYNIYDDSSEMLTICASEEAFKAAIESKIRDLKGSIEYYSKSLERVSNGTKNIKSCSDCKFYRENPKCMDEILCNEFKRANENK